MLGGNYWAMAQAQASEQSVALWAQRTAVEGGGAETGLGPWKEDMRPFADEATIHGPLCGDGADSWHAAILRRSLNGGIIYNGYHTSITLPQADFDCFVGGLVSTGIAPQMSGTGIPAQQLARVKYWMDLYSKHGMATESTIGVLHYPDVFLIGLRGGTSLTSSYGLLVGETLPHLRSACDSGAPSYGLALPSTLDDNATILTTQGSTASCVNLTVPAAQQLASITFFAANKLTLALAGEFWRHRAVTQTIVAVNGTRATSVVPASAGEVVLQLELGQYAAFSVASAA